jgi:hypothetical protein
LIDLFEEITHPMKIDTPKTSSIDKDTYIIGSGLGMGLWTPFQPSEVIYLRSFTYDSKTGRIV